MALRTTRASPAPGLSPGPAPGGDILRDPLGTDRLLGADPIQRTLVGRNGEHVWGKGIAEAVRAEDDLPLRKRIHLLHSIGQPIVVDGYEDLVTRILAGAFNAPLAVALARFGGRSIGELELEECKFDGGSSVEAPSSSRPEASLSSSSSAGPSASMSSSSSSSSSSVVPATPPVPLMPLVAGDDPKSDTALEQGSKWVDAAGWTEDQLQTYKNTTIGDGHTRDFCRKRCKVSLDRADVLIRRLRDAAAAEAQRLEAERLAVEMGGRDQGRIATALGLIDNWEQRKDKGKYVFEGVAGKEAQFAESLRRIVHRPFELDQADYPICGANAFLHSVCIYAPDSYVHYVLTLLHGGSASLDGLAVKAPEAVRAKKLGTSGRKISVAAWVAMASLRGGSNKRYHKIRRMTSAKVFFQNWHAGIAGMSTTSEISGWFAAMGCKVLAATDNDYSAYLFGSSFTADALVKVGEHYPANEVMLTVNAAQVSTGTVPSQPAKSGGADHVVRLASPVTRSGEDICFTVWTWGTRRQLVIHKSSVGKVVFGYVVAERPGQKKK